MDALSAEHEYSDISHSENEDIHAVVEEDYNDLHAQGILPSTLSFSRRGSINHSSHPNGIQRTPRKRIKCDYDYEFKKALGEEDAIKFLTQFRQYDESQDKEDNLIADGMINTLITSYDMTNTMLKSILRIGNNRYYRIKKGLHKRAPPGQNVNKVTEDMVKEMYVVVESLTVEEVESCSHKRSFKFIVEDGVHTWLHVYEKYCAFEIEKGVRKMSFKTFHRWVRHCLPGTYDYV